MKSVLAPLFVSVTSLLALVDPRATFPNERLDGDSDTVLTIVPVPMPVNPTTWGAFRAESDTVTPPEINPMFVGLKVVVTVQLAWEPKTVPHVLDWK